MAGRSTATTTAGATASSPIPRGDRSGGARWSGGARLADRGPGPGTASGSGAVVGYPGCLHLDHPPGGAVHLRHRQAEPVPQAPEPFAAGPGDRLLQLPLVDAIRRAAGGARRGAADLRADLRLVQCGQAVGALIWCRMIAGHGGLLGGVAGGMPLDERGGVMT